MLVDCVVKTAECESFNCVQGPGSLEFLVSNDHFMPASSIALEPQGAMVAKERILFCYYAVVKAIESFKEKNYSAFDGHTTSNCCHGMALLASHLIQSALELDLDKMEEEGKKRIEALESSREEAIQDEWMLPNTVINLACLYLLAFIKVSDPEKGGRTDTAKLKDISPISTKFSRKLAVDLQRRFSNWIAMRYAELLKGFEQEMDVAGARVQMWGKYVGAEHIRTDKRGVKYAPNLYAMQVVLAELSRTQGKMAIVNDLFDSQGSLKGRYVAILEGDGLGGFRALSEDEMKTLGMFHQNEPIVVFGGCAYSDALTMDTLKEQMEPWLTKAAHLILACDVFYPQFCRVHDDPDFNSAPVVPSEEHLLELIAVHGQVKGVSAADPSLYCAAHIYPASVSQVLQLDALPLSYVPGAKLAK
ncbi:MAG: hypothetical protein V4492_00820 [Chlamydiota bacterium]